MTYRDYTSSPVRFSNYMKFLVYIIEKIIEGNLKSAHILNQKEQKFDGDGEQGKKRKERYLNKDFFEVNTEVFDCSP